MKDGINPFRGLGTALITPFTCDGHVDFQSLERLVEHQIEGGVDFLCVLGTTAETPTLSPAERSEVMTCVARVNGGRVPLMLGAGSNCTKLTCDYIASLDLSAFAGLLIVAPYYNKPSQEGIYRHFMTVAQASPLPLIIYNVPGRTGVNVSAETTLRLAHDCPRIVAVKEASGNLAQIEQVINGAPQGFNVLCGDDSLVPVLIERGARGAVSVISNAFPREFGEVVRASSQPCFDRLSHLIRLTMADGNPSGIKSILHAMHEVENVLRLPLVPVCNAVENDIQEEVARVLQTCSC